MRKTLLLALGLVVGAAPLSGCGTTPEPDGRTASATRVDTAEPHRRPPVTELLFTPSIRSHEAQRRLAIACMANRGFRYAPGAGGAEGDTQLPQPFGLESATPSTESTPPAPETPPKPGSPESTAAYGQALFGDQDKRVTAKGSLMSVSRPGNGCLAEAEKRVLGDGRMRWLQVRIMLFEAQEQARTDVEKDPAFKAATARWRTCMNRAGSTEPDPVRLLASLRTAEARASSTALAADLRCKDETGYLDTAYSRLAAVQQRWLDRNPAVAEDWKALAARQERESRAVLSAAATSPRSE